MSGALPPPTSAETDSGHELLRHANEGDGPARDRASTSRRRPGPPMDLATQFVASSLVLFAGMLVLLLRKGSAQHRWIGWIFAGTISAAASAVMLVS